MVEPIRKTIEVPCNAETAFTIMTERVANWWPLETNSVSAMNGAVAKSVTIEPRVGGRVYEVRNDSETELWGKVQVYEPGARLVIAWHVMRPETEATEVEITFTALDGGGTRVDLEHRGWSVLGSDGAGMRESYNNGWANVFEDRYAGACAA